MDLINASTAQAVSSASRSEAAALHNSQLDLLRDKRVIILHVSLELGGAERQSLLLAKYLVDHCGAEVQVWGFRDEGATARLCEQLGIPWRIVDFEWPRGRISKLRSLVQFTRTLRRARPDVLLPYTPMPNVVCSLVWKWTGATCCIWNQRAVAPYRCGTLIERLAVRNARLFVSNSEHGADFLRSHYRLSADSVHVIPNGVSVEPPLQSRKVWRRRLGIEEHCFVACMVAVLRSNKDHATLLRAWRLVVDRLQDSGQPAVLLLAGRLDNAHEAAKALAFDLELGRSVRFLGHVDDIAGLLAGGELAVFSTHHEGVPNGVLECMAAGLAVVSTDHPGVREALGPKADQVLAPPGDESKLAELILDMAADRQKRELLGAANRLRIQQDFNPKVMCERMVRLILKGR